MCSTTHKTLTSGLTDINYYILFFNKKVLFFSYWEFLKVERLTFNFLRSESINDSF